MGRKLAWTDEAWKDYLYWQIQDKKTLKRINKLIEDIKRNDPFKGIGKPEPLKENLSGFWSRKIDDTNRLVYIVDVDFFTIISRRYHY
ncbi:toxin of the YoeB-YefM toxin-antitoxin system [Desulfamplus magnetovallimortis]|uniref:Putative mRNA interferase YoeB n=1 Tax=Desulfamplus magnetovallimortis TaxID=1246637 RepID=A0A1W1HEM6_9BACT|nr:Txe/YoeB family addiction module toxin [Desulfamplus magnetovallimortis]SLM30883.1 toxin of the YoeB-YefM toxin-antitoxin system [Desulfamplus magnetovallimortis]